MKPRKRCSFNEGGTKACHECRMTISKTSDRRRFKSGVAAKALALTAEGALCIFNSRISLGPYHRYPFVLHFILFPNYGRVLRDRSKLFSFVLHSLKVMDTQAWRTSFIVWFRMLCEGQDGPASCSNLATTQPHDLHQQDYEARMNSRRQTTLARLFLYKVVTFHVFDLVNGPVVDCFSLINVYMYNRNCFKMFGRNWELKESKESKESMRPGSLRENEDKRLVSHADWR